jgi:hypothetical protein
MKRVRDYHAEWIRTKAKLLIRRNFLIIKLGSKCRNCDTTEEIEIDHPNGKDWEAKALSPQMRMAKYEQEYEEGKLSLLCRSCNGKDGAQNKPFYSAVRHGEEVPF